MGTLHVHIGPGGLGLGLVVRSANEAEFDSHLIGREGSPAAVNQYSLALTGHRPLPLIADSYSEATRFDELCEDARRAMSSNMPMLITTAVGGELRACTSLIIEIASRRVGASTVFIACENHLGGASADLIEELERLGVDCRPTMVNRLCPKRTLTADETTLVAHADPHAEWMIEGEVDSEALERIERAPAVSFVPDVEPFAGRKLWLVNGAHLALALFARIKREPSIRAVAREVERLEQLVELQADMIQAFPSDWRRALDDDLAYARRQLVPFYRTEDSTKRVLKRLQRANLAPFLEDANRKLGEPARLYMASAGHPSFNFEDVFETLHEVLLDFELYEDTLKIRKREAQLTELADEQAVQAYDALLAGVTNPRTRIARVRRLRHRLDRHRSLISPV